jgi:hypothetical protein
MKKLIFLIIAISSILACKKEKEVEVTMNVFKGKLKYIHSYPKDTIYDYKYYFVYDSSTLKLKKIYLNDKLLLSTNYIRTDEAKYSIYVTPSKFGILTAKYNADRFTSITYKISGAPIDTIYKFNYDIAGKLANCFQVSKLFIYYNCFYYNFYFNDSNMFLNDYNLKYYDFSSSNIIKEGVTFEYNNILNPHNILHQNNFKRIQTINELPLDPLFILDLDRKIDNISNRNLKTKDELFLYDYEMKDGLVFKQTVRSILDDKYLITYEYEYY